MKKTFRIKIIIRGAEEEFKPGLGVGVLALGEYTYDIPETHDHTLLNASMLKDRNDLLSKIIMFQVEEVKDAETDKHQ